jgi:hypothetical protein
MIMGIEGTDGSRPGHALEATEGVVVVEDGVVLAVAEFIQPSVERFIAVAPGDVVLIGGGFQQPRLIVARPLGAPVRLVEDLGGNRSPPRCRRRQKTYMDGRG